jgi:hypothetical protein
MCGGKQRNAANTAIKVEKPSLISNLKPIAESMKIENNHADDWNSRQSAQHQSAAFGLR